MRVSGPPFRGGFNFFWVVVRCYGFWGFSGDHFPQPKLLVHMRGTESRTIRLIFSAATGIWNSVCMVKATRLGYCQPRRIWFLSSFGRFWQVRRFMSGGNASSIRTATKQEYCHAFLCHKLAREKLSSALIQRPRETQISPEKRASC